MALQRTYWLVPLRDCHSASLPGWRLRVVGSLGSHFQLPSCYPNLSPVSILQPNPRTCIYGKERVRLCKQPKKNPGDFIPTIHKLYIWCLKKLEESGPIFGEISTPITIFLFVKFDFWSGLLADLNLKTTMGRPRASNTIRDFAATFATTVTVPSTCQYDWMARTGKHGVFTLLSQLAPKVCDHERMRAKIFLFFD